MAKTTTKKKKSIKPIDAPGLLVSDRVEILDVRLISCQVEQTPEATSDVPKDIELQAQTEVETNPDLNLVLVFVDFALTAHLKDTPKQAPALQISSKFLLTYSISDFEGLTEKAFQQFGEMNGIYNAWPYCREFIQNTTARMGIKPLTLPVFRIASKAEKTKRKAPSKKTVKKKARKASN